MDKAPLGPWSSAARALKLCSIGLLAVGCGKVSEAAPSAASAQNAPPSPNAVPNAAQPAPVGAASFDNANYSVKIAPAGPCKKDQTCSAEIVVQAKGEYHINDKYPYRFKLEDPPATGLKYPKAVIGKEDGTMDEHKVTLKVPFVPASAGDKKVAGTLSLSVCSAANCLMDKQQLDLTVKVD
ncbi:MAG TPA: hypothetical protein VK550_19855 [Polyangiaceae bacterium]|nr:hypothetical protein [Polyangiaceae bacterium]